MDRPSYQEEIRFGMRPDIAKLGRMMPENVCTPNERRALNALKMLHRDDLLEYVDSIVTGRIDNKGREARLTGLLCALADARAALGDG